MPPPPHQPNVALWRQQTHFNEVTCSDHWGLTPEIIGYNPPYDPSTGSTFDLQLRLKQGTGLTWIPVKRNLVSVHQKTIKYIFRVYAKHGRCCYTKA